MSKIKKVAINKRGSDSKGAWFELCEGLTFDVKYLGYPVKCYTVILGKAKGKLMPVECADVIKTTQAY